MAAKKTNTQVELKPMELADTPITIVGDTPLIVHAWGRKAKQEMLDKQRGVGGKAKREAKIPANDFKNSLYWLTDMPEDGADDEEAERNVFGAIEAGAKFGFNLGGIKQSIVMGSKRGGLDVVGTELRASFFLLGRTEASTIDLAEIVGDAPEMREDMVRVGGMSKTADIRHRGEFKHWEIPLTIRWNVNGKYTIDQLVNCANVGGFACGIGEWRPEKDGQFGMYHVELR